MTRNPYWDRWTYEVYADHELVAEYRTLAEAILDVMERGDAGYQGHVRIGEVTHHENGHLTYGTVWQGPAHRLGVK